MSVKSKKSSFVEAAKALLTEGIKKRFPTYDAAIAEIGRLEIALNQLEQDYQSSIYKIKRVRQAGQPKKKQTNQIKKAFPFLSEWMRRRHNPAAKGGRPPKNTRSQMIALLNKFDDEKKLHAKEKRKKIITDKEFIEYRINTDQKTKSLPEYRRRDEIRQYRDTIKYFRDQTGIRQKRKTT